MDVRRSLLIAACLLATPQLARPAAPFVSGEPQRFATQIAAARAAIIARPGKAADPQASWTIASVLKDSTGNVVAGTSIRPKPAPPADARSALLISNADRTVVMRALTDEAAAYLLSLPRADKAVGQRFDHAIKHLRSTDAMISADVFAELASFERTAFEKLRDHLPADVLRSLIDDPATTGERLGLYGYMLGLCGHVDDANRLLERFLSADGIASGADGLAAGYLLLAGEPGLATLEMHVLLSDTKSPLLAASLFEALRFFRDSENGPFRRDRLSQCACCGLTRPDTADLAIGYLVAAREWSTLPRVVDALDATDPDPTRKRAVQVMVVRFLLECRRDVDTTAANRVLAGSALSRIASADPDLMRRAEHLAGVRDDVR
jgi:hypothetical protein